MHIDKYCFLIKFLPGLLLLALLSSCGFHLRGAYQLPAVMHTTFIEVNDGNSDLIRSLKRSLKASDITLSENRSTASAVFKVTGEQKTKRIVSVDAKGRAREYTLIYSINFSLKATQGDFELAEQTISINRDFLFDTEDVLGKSKEESQLYVEMELDIVRLILLRLQSKAQQ